MEFKVPVLLLGACSVIHSIGEFPVQLSITGVIDNSLNLNLHHVGAVFRTLS